MNTQKKDNPTGIRFNKERTNKIMREHGFKTKQQVVNFLFDFYEGKNLYIVGLDKYRKGGKDKLLEANPPIEAQAPTKIEKPEREPGEGFFEFTKRLRAWELENEQPTG